MASSSSSAHVRKEILDLVGKGHTSAEIEFRLGTTANEKDLEYAASLVRVRDSFRSESFGNQQRTRTAA
jgi:hypothetical protein